MAVGSWAILLLAAQISVVSGASDGTNGMESAHSSSTPRYRLVDEVLSLMDTTRFRVETLSEVGTSHCRQ